MITWPSNPFLTRFQSHWQSTTKLRSWLRHDHRPTLNQRFWDKVHSRAQGDLARTRTAQCVSRPDKLRTKWTQTPHREEREWRLIPYLFNLGMSKVVIGHLHQWFSHRGMMMMMRMMIMSLSITIGDDITRVRNRTGGWWVGLIHRVVWEILRRVWVTI